MRNNIVPPLQFCIELSHKQFIEKDGRQRADRWGDLRLALMDELPRRLVFFPAIAAADVEPQVVRLSFG